MNIQKLFRRTRGHRHLVVVPAFLLVLTLSLRQGMSLPGDITASAGGPDGVISVAGVTGLLPDGGQLSAKDDILVLKRGTLVAASDGFIRVVAGPYELRGWNGAFQVTWDDDVLSVAGFTTPVLVTEGDDRTVVPPATQWKAPGTWADLAADPAGWLAQRTVKPLPVHFLRDRLTLLASLPDAGPSDAAVMADMAFLDVLRLPDAKRRNDREMRSAILSQILHDPSAAAGLSADPRFEQALDEASEATLAELASAVPSGIGSDRILAAFMRGTEGSLLATFHPASRDRAWVLGAEPETQDADALRLLLLPQLDVSDETMLQLASDRWETAFAAFLASREDAPAILKAWIPGAVKRIAAFTAAGLPLRAGAYADAVRDLTLPYKDAVGSAHVPELAAALVPPVIERAEEEEVSGEEVAEPAPAELSAEAARMIEENAMNWLREAGASLTVSTSVVALDEHHAGVDHVVFPTSRGDMEAAFRIDIETGEVSGVRHQGQELPYALPFDAFIAWVREGMDVTK